MIPLGRLMRRSARPKWADTAVGMSLPVQLVEVKRDTEALKALLTLMLVCHLPVILQVNQQCSDTKF